MASSLFSRYLRGQRQREERKNNPELMEKYYKQQKKSYQKHRAKRLEQAKIWHKEMREVAISIGNCSACYKENDNPKYKLCSKCRKFRRDWYKLHHKGKSGLISPR